jgi:hypothetical protein
MTDLKRRPNRSDSRYLRLDSRSCVSTLFILWSLGMPLSQRGRSNTGNQQQFQSTASPRSVSTIGSPVAPSGADVGRGAGAGYHLIINRHAQIFGQAFTLGQHRRYRRLSDSQMSPCSDCPSEPTRSSESPLSPSTSRTGRETSFCPRRRGRYPFSQCRAP